MVRATKYTAGLTLALGFGLGAAMIPLRAAAEDKKQEAKGAVCKMTSNSRLRSM